MIMAIICSVLTLWGNAALGILHNILILFKPRNIPVN